jgi:ribosome assembly protein 1
VDPFFTPKTEEEREEFGEDGDAGPNIARKLVDATRRRKGLKVRVSFFRLISPRNNPPRTLFLCTCINLSSSLSQVEEKVVKVATKQRTMSRKA